MTDPAGTEKTELDSESTSDDATTGETTGINQEHAEELAAADYQKRMEEFDNADTATPVVSPPSPGESGAVEMPKPQ